MALANLDQSDALASIVRNVRKAGIFGLLGGRRGNGFPHQPVTPTPQMQFREATNSHIADSMEGFDADAYRKEMTDLVYRRSLERGFSN